MSEPKSQSGPLPERPRTNPTAGWLLALVLLAPGSAGAAGETLAPDRAEPEVFGVDTGLGRIEYRAGRGLRVGDTGLTVGGFATAAAELPEGEGARGELEGVNFLLFFDPAPFLHLFTELEVSELARWDDEHEGIRSDPATKVERLFGDAAASDALNLRFGKFLTPIGRWNQAPAEPLVWTTSEPLVVEEVFDETVSGAMLWGATFPQDGALSDSLYGTFLDPIEPDVDAPPADHSAGARLEWASLGGWTVGASYYLSEPQEEAEEWNHLGGADLLWQPTGRVELSGEVLFGEGTREEGALWGLYAQAAVETVRTLYAVGRYERFEPPAAARGLDLYDVGLTWVPLDYLRLKADYLFVDHSDELSDELIEPGFRASLSLLF